MNEQHVGIWADMCARSNPPITNTPLSAFTEEHHLKRAHVALNADKFKKMIGYKLKYPYFREETVRDMIDKWKAENSWPNVSRK